MIFFEYILLLLKLIDFLFISFSFLNLRSFVFTQRGTTPKLISTSSLCGRSKKREGKGGEGVREKSAKGKITTPLPFCLPPNSLPFRLLLRTLSTSGIKDNNRLLISAAPSCITRDFKIQRRRRQREP